MRSSDRPSLIVKRQRHPFEGPAEPGDRRQHRGRQRGQHLPRRTVDDPALAIERPHPVGDADHPLQPVLGEHDRQTEVVVEPVQRGDHVLGAPRIELAGRLVEDQHPRLQRQSGGDRDPLPLAAGEGAEIATAQRGDAEQVEHLLDPLAHRHRRDAELLHPEGQLVLDDRRDELRLRLLEDEPDLGAQDPRAVAARVETAHRHTAAEAAAGEVRHQPVQAAQHGRLAAAGRPGQHDEVALLDPPVDVAQHRPPGAGVGKGNAVERNLCRGWAKAGAHARSSPAGGGATRAGASNASKPIRRGRLAAGAVSDG